MFEAIKKLFTKIVQLTSKFFQKAEVVDENVIDKTNDFVSSEVIEEPLPKIKHLKQNRKAL